jgi:glutamate/tyrosine decarboxylase-like PLP-dependent enzyme
MLNKIKELEKVARGLESNPAERTEMLKLVELQAEFFLNGLAEGNTYNSNSGRSSRLDGHFSEQPGEFKELLKEFHEGVDGEGINAASGGHMGYIPGGGMYASALGDFLADVGNYYAGVMFASPGAVKIEHDLIRWMADLVGYPKAAGGDLTSGGSIANLTAIVTAREMMDVRARDVENSCVYLTEGTHHCVDKALRAAGLSECPKRVVPMDDGFRMNVTALQNLIEQDRADGHRPWLVVASAGTTDTGAVDPIKAIANQCEQHDIWLHVDAAYGGFFLLCEHGRQVLEGIERAHSIVLDPHKGMFLPYGSGALLVRDVAWLAQSQAFNAGYMQDAKTEEGVYSPADLSLELTRPFRGLRFWLPLKLYGVSAFRAALTEKICLARYFYQQLAQLPDWEMGPYPELSVVTFRFLPLDQDANSFNECLIKAVLEDGKVFISSTRINGKFVLRLAVLHFRTHLQEVDYLLNFLEHKAAELSQ